MRTLVCLLFLAGCGFSPPDADVISRRGVSSYFGKSHHSGLSIRNADDMEDYLAKGLEPYGYSEADVDRGLLGLAIHWVPDLFICEGETSQLCAGQTNVITHSTVLAEGGFDCPWYSAYIHEELHAIQWAKGYPVDYDHKRPEWVSVIDSRQMWCDY